MSPKVEVPGSSHCSKQMNKEEKEQGSLQEWVELWVGEDVPSALMGRCQENGLDVKAG